MNDAALIQAAPPARIAAVLGHGVSAALVERIHRLARLQPRLTTLVVARLDDPSPPHWAPDQPQRTALAMAASELASLANQAGAVFHAPSIASLISSQSQRLLIEALGLEPYRRALTLAPLAPAAEPWVHAPGDLRDDIMRDRIEGLRADGAACLAAWCARQPHPVAARLALLRPEASPLPVHDRFGPAIVTALLEA